jgi:TonB family protein
LGSQDQRLLRSALVFSLGAHLVLIFGVLVSPASEEAIATANRAVTVLLRRATEAPLAALAEASAHQQGVTVSGDRVAMEDVSQYQQTAPSLNNSAQKASRMTSRSNALPQHQSPVAARAALEAEYVRRWQVAIEQFGNAQYRDTAKHHGNGDVRLRVRVDSQGGLRGIQVLATSGEAALDRAAIETVERLAPFSAFPPALANSVEELDIIRTWQFRD